MHIRDMILDRIEEDIEAGAYCLDDLRWLVAELRKTRDNLKHIAAMPNKKGYVSIAIRRIVRRARIALGEEE